MRETPPRSAWAPGAGDHPDSEPDTGAPEEGFVEEPGFSIHLPADLDGWVPWVGGAVVVAAALQATTSLVGGTLAGWTPNTQVSPFPAPGVAASLLLLAGVLVLVIGRGEAPSASRSRWFSLLACLAAGTAAALVVTQLVGSVEGVTQSRGGLALLPNQVAAAVLGAIGGAASVVVDAGSAALALLLHRWSRLAAGTGDQGVTARVPLRRPVGAMVMGATVGVACLAAFQAGVSRSSNLLEVAPSPPPVVVPTITVLPAIIVSPLPSSCTQQSDGTFVCRASVPAAAATPAYPCPNTIEGALCLVGRATPPSPSPRA
jgi:hypothetical protein